MADIRLNIKSGPRFNLRTNSGMYEKLDLGNSVPVAVRDYEKLDNKPRINGVELIGNKTTAQLRIPDIVPIPNAEIETLLQSVFG